MYTPESKKKKEGYKVWLYLLSVCIKCRMKRDKGKKWERELNWIDEENEESWRAKVGDPAASIISTGAEQQRDQRLVRGEIGAEGTWNGEQDRRTESFHEPI